MITRPHHFAFTLIEAMIREDTDLLDATVSEIDSDPHLKTGVICAVAGMLAASMNNAHGPIGALAQLDRSRAEFAMRDNGWA